MSGENNRLAALAADIRAAHQDVRSAARTLTERALAVGTALNEAKRLVAHGEWTPWLRENCGLSERTARRYMAFAAARFKTANVAVLGIRRAEALARKRMAAAEADRNIPPSPEQARTDRHARSQTAGETASASDSGSSAGDTVIRADDPQDHNLIERQQEAERVRQGERSSSNRARLTRVSSTVEPQPAMTSQELQPAEPRPGRSSPNRQNSGPANRGGRRPNSMQNMPGAELFGDALLPALVKDKSEITEAAKCAKRADRERARENSRQFAQLLKVHIPGHLLPQAIAFLGHCNPDDVIKFIRQEQLL